VGVHKLIAIRIIATLLGFVLFAISCTHDRFETADRFCRNGNTPSECGDAGYFAYKLGNLEYGDNMLKQYCFIDVDPEICDKLQSVSPNYERLKEDLLREDQRLREEEKKEQVRQAMFEKELEVSLQTDCKSMVRIGYAENYGVCMEHAGSDLFKLCNESFKSKNKQYPNLKKCIWAQENPIEWYCEQKVKEIGGNMWECLRVVEERIAREDEKRFREEERTTRARQHQDLISQQEKYEAQRRREKELDSLREILKDATKGFEEKKSVDCVPNYLGGFICKED